MDQVCLCCRLTMGWIRFSEGERKFDCISSPNSVHPVPVHVEEVKDIISVAQYILVVEKESVFQRLANDQFCNVNHCIVITGRGYPDIPTRRCELFFSYAYDVMLSSHMPTGLFVNPSKCVCLCAKLGTYMLNISLIIFILYTNRFLRLLVENLRLPVYCLVDCDPYGFDILTTYRFGSMVSIC
ncbi:hypothetical protein VIGAN_03019100 [Vigna angularis var. angularis]|uniref:Topoisomerase 6 subunit A/Spo11 TOPRIM domain-containing protein n=1 Tax=Vigna angularis var. angularis TaxID=157739 RepID=A0A0S3RJ08_PHAAN|nr:hypothetical protein VIGAN_03019100 [Vigna angularis var. angularis]